MTAVAGVRATTVPAPPERPLTLCSSSVIRSEKARALFPDLRDTPPLASSPGRTGRQGLGKEQALRRRYLFSKPRAQKRV
jgi:hypothetical protein